LMWPHLSLLTVSDRRSGRRACFHIFPGKGEDMKKKDINKRKKGDEGNGEVHREIDCKVWGEFDRK